MRRINPPLLNRTRNSAKALRANMTDAERALWYRLRAGYLNGLKFRRQHPVPLYIVDFYCEQAKLVVELTDLNMTRLSTQCALELLKHGA